MSGIVGYVSKDKPKKNVLKDMTDSIKHRGLDGEGFYIDDVCAFGHRRLAIIDLEKGSQPIYNETKDLVVIFDGFIYNFEELKKELIKKKHKFETNCDTEVIVHGFEQWHDDVFKKLRGMFAIAIWDKNNQKLILARDGWGTKPLYYYKNEAVFMFASEIKAFLQHPSFEKEFNEEILASYLCFNSVPTEETFFKGVFRVKPGHILEIDSDKLTDTEFFKLEFEEKEEDLEKVTEKIEKAMEDSVKHHMIADVKVGSFLSSGIDSSYIVSLAKPETTFTVGYDDPKYDEISYAKDLAEKLNITNKSKIIKKEEYLKMLPEILYHMDEPLADPAAIALYFGSKAASEDVKVVMSGEGADELFGGYNSYQEEVSQSWYMKIPFFIRRTASFFASLFPDARGLNFIYRRGLKLEEYNIGLGRIFRDKEALSLVNNKKQVMPMDIVKPYYETYKDNSDLVKRQVIDFYFWLINDFLHAVDRCTTMFGVEGRTPYLDTKVYEVAKSVSVSNKINKSQTKIALRNAAQKRIPNESYKKKKLGFPVPLREWMKEEDLYLDIKKYFESEVASKYFDQKKILKLLENHKTGKKDCYKKVWTIYTFLVWYDKYFG